MGVGELVVVNLRNNCFCYYFCGECIWCLKTAVVFVESRVKYNKTITHPLEEKKEELVKEYYQIKLYRNANRKHCIKVVLYTIIISSWHSCLLLVSHTSKVVWCKNKEK